LGGYGEAFSVQSFGISLATKTMTGAQIHDVLAPSCD
jgi:hypothetical protein